MQCKHNDETFRNFNGKLLVTNPLKNTKRQFLRIYIKNAD